MAVSSGLSETSSRPEGLVAGDRQLVREHEVQGRPGLLQISEAPGVERPRSRARPAGAAILGEPASARPGRAQVGVGVTPLALPKSPVFALRPVPQPAQAPLAPSRQVALADLHVEPDAEGDDLAQLVHGGEGQVGDGGPKVNVASRRRSTSRARRLKRAP